MKLNKEEMIKMKEKIAKNINSILFVIALIIIVVTMFIFIKQKEGWHEDEIFSYGSSNYKYDNMFQRHGDKSSVNAVIYEKIIDKNPMKTISNAYYYLTHKEEFNKINEEKIKQEQPVWKTPQDALEYLSVSSDEILDYWPIYYNQSVDVHPPLFYMLVHLASSFYLNHFSKYIIFMINIVFLVGSCFIIRKILKLFNKEYLSAGIILLYGLSMGGISIVMFQRMYMMLTFFVLMYLYLILKIEKNQFVMDKKTKRVLILTTILGFLTQYYFCIYAVILSIVCIIAMIKRKKMKELKNYIACHIKSAIIGIILFPASIYHIFFSYRGMAGGVVETSYIERVLEYIQKIFYAYSLPEIVGYIVIGTLIVIGVMKFVKTKKKDIICIITIPTVIYVLVITKIAPYVNIRYIAPILPIIAIGVVLAIENSIKWILQEIKQQKSQYGKLYEFCNRYLVNTILIVLIIVISIYGFTHSEPEFLASYYKDRMKVAEENKDLKLVYIAGAEFVYLQDIEEFLKYDGSLILTAPEIEVLKDDEVIQQEKEYILNIKSWIWESDEILQQILEYTNATRYELLEEDIGSKVYKIYRNLN